MPENIGSLKVSIRMDGMEQFLNDLDNASQKIARLEKQTNKSIDLKMNAFNTQEIEKATAKSLDVIDKKLIAFQHNVIQKGSDITRQMEAYSNRIKTYIIQQQPAQPIVTTPKSVQTTSINSIANTTYQYGTKEKSIQYYAKNLKDASNTLEQIYSSQGKISNIKLDKSTNTLTASVTRANGQVIALRGYLDSAGNVQISENITKGASKLSKVLDGIKGKVVGIVNSFITPAKLLSYIKNGINYVTELDNSLAQMRLSTNESQSSLRNFQEESFKIGSSIGTSAMAIQDTATHFLNLGYSIEEAKKLSKNTNLFASISGMDAGESQKQLLTAIKTFRDEFESDVSASSNIIDRYIELSRKFGISSSQISSDMNANASTLESAGYTLNESLGLITAGNKLSIDAASISNAMNVISLRVNGATAELEALGEETDHYSSSTTRLREALLHLTGVDIAFDNGSLKSTAQIMKELSEVWNTLGDSRSTAIKVLAGNDQSGVVKSLLDNTGIMKEVENAAQHSSGAAVKANEVMLETISGKMTVLTNQTKEFWSVLLEDGTVETIITGLTNVLGLITTIVKHVGGLPTILATISGYLSLKNIGRGKCCPSK